MGCAVLLATPFHSMLVTTQAPALPIHPHVPYKEPGRQRERERERDIYIYIHVCIYTHTHRYRYVTPLTTLRAM